MPDHPGDLCIANTVSELTPAEGAHLHLHHEHPRSVLRGVRRLAFYPLQQVHQLANDLGIEQLRFEAGAACFSVVNRGALDVSDVGVAVVLNDRYSDHRYLRLPWLAAGGSEQFSLPLCLEGGVHRLEVIADPGHQILEEASLQANNRAVLEVRC